MNFHKVSKLLFPVHNAPWANDLAINLRDIKLCDASIVSYNKYKPHASGPDEVDRSIKKILCFPNSNFIISGVALSRTSIILFDTMRQDFSSINIPKVIFVFIIQNYDIVRQEVIPVYGYDCHYFERARQCYMSILHYSSVLTTYFYTQTRIWYTQQLILSIYGI